MFWEAKCVSAKEIAVQIQDKFKPVIQGTWRQGKITFT